MDAQIAELLAKLTAVVESLQEATGVLRESAGKTTYNSERYDSDHNLVIVPETRTEDTRSTDSTPNYPIDTMFKAFADEHMRLMYELTGGMATLLQPIKLKRSPYSDNLQIQQRQVKYLSSIAVSMAEVARQSQTVPHLPTVVPPPLPRQGNDKIPEMLAEMLKFGHTMTYFLDSLLNQQLSPDNNVSAGSGLTTEKSAEWKAIAVIFRNTLSETENFGLRTSSEKKVEPTGGILSPTINRMSFIDKVMAGLGMGALALGWLYDGITKGDSLTGIRQVLVKFGGNLFTKIVSSLFKAPGAIIHAIMGSGLVDDALNVSSKSGFLKRIAMKVGGLFLKFFKGGLAKGIPILGGLISFGFAWGRFERGDIVGGIIDIFGGIVNMLGIIPGAAAITGPLSMGISVLNALLDLKAGGSDAEANVKKLDFLGGLAGKVGSFTIEMIDKLKNIPILNTIWHLKEGIFKFIDGDWKGGLTELSKSIPFVAAIQELWNHREDIGAGAVTSIKFVGGFAKSAIDWVLSTPVGKMFKSLADGIGSFISGNVSDAFSKLGEFIPSFSSIADFFKSTATGITSVAGKGLDLASGLKSAAKNITSSIYNMLPEWLRATLTLDGAGNILSTAGEAIKQGASVASDQMGNLIDKTIWAAADAIDAGKAGLINLSNSANSSMEVVKDTMQTAIKDVKVDLQNATITTIKSVAETEIALLQRQLGENKTTNKLLVDLHRAIISNMGTPMMPASQTQQSHITVPPMGEATRTGYGDGYLSA